jgi:hypothetical protein
MMLCTCRGFVYVVFCIINERNLVFIVYWTTGDRCPAGTRKDFFSSLHRCVQTGSMVHSASFPTSLSPGVQRSGRDADHTSPSGAEFKNAWNYEGFSKSLRTGRLERELQLVQLSATRCSCIAILWVSLVSFASITLCVASQRVFIVVYFVIDSVRKLLVIPSYTSFPPYVLVAWCLIKHRGRNFLCVFATYINFGALFRWWLFCNELRFSYATFETYFEPIILLPCDHTSFATVLRTELEFSER